MRSEDRPLHRLYRLHGPQIPVTLSTERIDQYHEKIEKGAIASQGQDVELGYAPGPRAERGARTFLALTFLVAIALFHFLAPGSYTSTLSLPAESAHLRQDQVCPQTDAIAPVKNSALLDALEVKYRSDDFKLNAYESLGGAIRIP